MQSRCPSWLCAVPLLFALANAAGCAEQPLAPPPPVTPEPPVGGEKPALAEVAVVHAVLELYADTTDPAVAAWAAEQQTAWRQAFGDALVVRLFSPDDKTNYARLTALETAAGLKEFAAVEAFLYPSPEKSDMEAAPAALAPAATLHPIALVGQKEIESRGAAAVKAITQPRKGMLAAKHPDAVTAAAQKLIKAHARQYTLPDDFPGKIDPAARGLVARWELNYADQVHRIPQRMTLVLLYLPIDCPVCADTELLALLAGDNIAGIEPLRPIERYGALIPDEAQKFLAQFAKMPVNADLPQRMTKVDGIAGATKTVTNVKTLLGDLGRAEALKPVAP